MSNELSEVIAKYFELGVSSTKELLIEAMNEIEKETPGVTFTTGDIQEMVAVIDEKFPTEKEMQGLDNVEMGTLQ